MLQKNLWFQKSSIRSRFPEIFEGQFRVRRRLEAWWGRMMDRSPRQLKFQRSGRVVVGIAFAVGFAAINTGNNLLFLGWGLVLSAIVLSGVLSEAAIRSLALSISAPRRIRAQTPTGISLLVENSASRIPAFGVEGDLRFDTIDNQHDVSLPYQLKIPADRTTEVFARTTFDHRGRHQLGRARFATTYPFGFFQKFRKIKVRPSNILVAPPQVEVEHLLQELAFLWGEEKTARVGLGDEFYALREYKAGDDPRHIHWRKSAAGERLFCNEFHVPGGRMVNLSLHLSPKLSKNRRERAIAEASSLAEALCLRGMSIAFSGPGFKIAPGAGESQAWAILHALCDFKLDAKTLRFAKAFGEAEVALCCGVEGPPEATAVLELCDET